MSYALHELDEKMDRYLKDIENGFYIETGASNGIWQSNTKLLNERYNWTGLLIEANPIIVQQCRLNRPNDIVENFALVSEATYKKTESVSGYFQFTDYNTSLRAHVSNDREKERIDWVHEPIAVPCITLTELLIKHKVEKVDFFSLDVEGYEMEVLNGLDFQRWSPTFILVETANKKCQQEATFSFLSEKGYDLIENISCNDDLYKIK